MPLVIFVSGIKKLVNVDDNFIGEMKIVFLQNCNQPRRNNTLSLLLCRIVKMKSVCACLHDNF